MSWWTEKISASFSPSSALAFSIEHAERVHGLPLCAFKAQLFLLRGDCLPDGGLLRAEKDDFSGGKALGNGKP